MKQNKKPLLIALAALATALLIVLAVMLLLRGRGAGQTNGDADAPYPYTWTEEQDGTITLTLDVGETGGAWRVGDADGRLLKAAVGETERNKTQATLTPVDEGRETVIFELVSGEDRLAELRLIAEVEQTDGGYAATILSHSERAMQATVSGGDEAHPFTVSSGGEGGLTVFIADTAEYEDTGWTAESSDSLVAAVTDVTTLREDENSGVQVALEPRASGSAEITVSNEAADLAYVFTVEVSGGEMRLTDSRMGPY